MTKQLKAEIQMTYYHCGKAYENVQKKEMEMLHSNNECALYFYDIKCHFHHHFFFHPSRQLISSSYPTIAYFLHSSHNVNDNGVNFQASQCGAYPERCAE